MDTKKKLQRLNNKEEVNSWKTIMFTYRTVFNELEKTLQKEGCSIPKFQILYTLYFEGALKQVQVAKKSKVTKSNISTFMKRMEMDKLVTKVYKDEEKCPRFKLTKKGEVFFERIFPDHVKNITKYVKPMPKEALAYLIEIQNNGKE